MTLSGKKIVLCVSGSIAAYKTPELTRQLVKRGAEVKIICTDAATKFVSPLALSTVSKNEVLWQINEGASWNNHVYLGRWADAILIAPCSANTLAKMANGLCDNLLNAVYLSATCPVIVAPAMDEDMWHHPSTQSNLNRIEKYGNQIIPVGHGELASGLVGDGRMAEIEDIVSYLENFLLKKTLPLRGKSVLVSAGPTYERLDPVRFIGNFSTGKMGIALADYLAKLGANVNLVLGPTHLRPTNKMVQCVMVESAQEMFNACTSIFPNADCGIMAAAVADYRPKEIAEEKIKKNDDTLALQLQKNPDILYKLGQQKKPNQILVGFALETNNEEENAQKKLEKKNADFIVLNSLQDAGAGFGGDTNKVKILGANGTKKDFGLQSKAAIARCIIDYIFQI